MAVEFVWITRSPTDPIIPRLENTWATGAPAMSAIRIVAGGNPIGTLIVTATANTAEVVEATVEIEIVILMAAIVVTGVIDVARCQVGEEDDIHQITSIGAAGVIREALLVEVAQPEVDGITMLLPEHLLRLLLPTRLRCLAGEWLGHCA